MDRDAKDVQYDDTYSMIHRMIHSMFEKRSRNVKNACMHASKGRG